LNDFPAAELLDAFTVFEVGIFLDDLRRSKNKERVLEELQEFKDGSEFSAIVADWATTNITLRRGTRTREELIGDSRHCFPHGLKLRTERVRGQIAQQLVPGMFLVLLNLRHHAPHFLQHWWRRVVVHIPLQ
jgi:hypothetical protein